LSGIDQPDKSKEVTPMADYETLHVTQLEGVMKVVLDRPKANAFNLLMVDELMAAFKLAGRDDGVRCLILTGAGRIFSAGQDLGELGEVDGEVSFRAHLRKTYNPLIKRMRELEKPILGAINGPAAGAGLGIALATDIRLAAEDARFVFGFSGIGLTTDSGTSVSLPRLIGLARASYLAFTNDPVTAQDALAWGLVNRVVPAEALATEAESLASRLAEGPTRAIGLTKRAFNRTVFPDLTEALDYEAHLQETAGRTEDHAEGVAAFREKRPPEFKGR
jgi:2-(1,2-epoxy-1,2-dihydrophenyl)acetyl-CoA isomerase